LTVGVVANIVATLFSLPLLLLLALAAGLTRSLSVLPLGIVLLLGILPNPAAAGVQFVARELAHKEPIYVREHWDGLRRYAIPSLKLWLLSLLGTAIIGFNVIFYAGLHSAFAGLLTIVWLYILLTWLAVHLYVFPLLIEQEVKGALLVYRNAVVIAITRPLFTLILVPLWVVVLLLAASSGLVAVIGLALGAAIQHNAAVRVLPTFAARRPD
jgi:uncharacterized membrane protein YesL